MLSYGSLMPNIKSAKKALRSSLRKRQYNNFWKNRIKQAEKSLSDKIETKDTGIDILNAGLTALQKALDKAAKNNVIHKNKANRIKSGYAKKITAQFEKLSGGSTSSEPSKKGKKSGASKQSKS
jgi:small subunit ribosomal protein S20